MFQHLYSAIKNIEIILSAKDSEESVYRRYAMDGWDVTISRSILSNSYDKILFEPNENYLKLFTISCTFFPISFSLGKRFYLKGKLYFNFVPSLNSLNDLSEDMMPLVLKNINLIKEENEQLFGNIYFYKLYIDVDELKKHYEV